MTISISKNEDQSYTIRYGEGMFDWIVADPYNSIEEIYESIQFGKEETKEINNN